MSLKHYGIFVAFGPNTELRAEGLGRYLASFLGGAHQLEDARFILVCPNWGHASLRALFEGEGIASHQVSIMSPGGLPFVLWLYRLLALGKRKAAWLWRIGALLRGRIETVRNMLASRQISVRKPLSLLRLPLWYAPLLVLLSPILLAGLLMFRAVQAGRVLVIRRIMSAELQRMHRLVGKLGHVRAWYCPTAFWPAFNRIKAPRLMCVPDVVLGDFSVGFARLGDDRSLQGLADIEEAIRQADRLVTYSSAVKWGTLVDRYAVPADRVSVIHHASSELSHHIACVGLPDPEAAVRSYSRTLLARVMRRSTNKEYTAGFANMDMKFLFYASQQRPNKNILTLLRAYRHLLRGRYLPHKLVLTCWPSGEVAEFVAEHHLDKDVLFLPGLTVPELAACYKLADLAVNPSLSEGGCPFTFTEALSVGTPVVMSRIAVTEEVLHERDLQEATFFDPYDWRDMAARIEWAVAHREQLLDIQQVVYERVRQRSWSDVVAEHVAVMDQMVAVREGRS